MRAKRYQTHYFVMAGLVPAIHDISLLKTWMPGTEAGHDDEIVERGAA